MLADYYCELCDTTYELNEAKSEMPCPKCGTIAKRVWSKPAAIHFKGTGFYKTDYPQNNKGNK